MRNDEKLRASAGGWEKYVGIPIGLVAGLEYALFVILNSRPTTRAAVAIVALCTLGGGAFGYLGLGYVTRRPFVWMERKLRQAPVLDVAAALLGMTVGLSLAAGASLAVTRLPDGWNKWVTLGIALMLGYTGLMLGLQRRAELLALVKGRPEGMGQPILLSAEAIMDGRLPALCKLGFIRGVLLAPHDVLLEIQAGADSQDYRLRNRGRLGLAVVEEMRAFEGVHLEFPPSPPRHEAREGLVSMARKNKAVLLTASPENAALARGSGVEALSLGEMAFALRPVALPGTEIEVEILRLGKDRGQGVASLPDGTLVVVEGGAGLMGAGKVRVTVGSAIQNATGRIVFCRPVKAGKV